MGKKMIQILLENDYVLKALKVLKTLKVLTITATDALPASLQTSPAMALRRLLW